MEDEGARKFSETLPVYLVAAGTDLFYKLHYHDKKSV